MSSVRKFFGEVIVEYSASIVAGVLSGAGACLVGDSLITAIAEYHYEWYLQHWFIVLMGVLISIMQVSHTQRLSLLRHDRRSPAARPHREGHPPRELHPIYREQEGMEAEARK